MNLSIDIARRYLFGKKSTNAINWITWIVIAGMAIGTAVMIISMSFFNGFESIISNMVNSYNPDYKVYPIKGQYLELDSMQWNQVKQSDHIGEVSRSVQEVALFEYDGSQEAGIIKGVDENYINVTEIDSNIVRGNFIIKEGNINYGVLGIGIFNKLSVNPSDGLTPINIYMPKRKKKGPLDRDYVMKSFYAKGVFSVNNDEDSQVIISDFNFVNRLLDKKNAVSYLEIKANPGHNESRLREELQQILGENIIIKNRYEQEESYLRIMNIEKWVTFLLVALTILIISFNLVGSLWMIVIDKKKDISILMSMGFTSSEVRKIFMYLGILIGVVGMIVGVFLAIVFFVIQKQYGIISVPPGFMIDAYPIELKWTDFFISAITVLFISFLASIFPSRKVKTDMLYREVT